MSYGSGFAQGMQAGSGLVSNIINMKNGMERANQQKTLFDQSQSDRAQQGQLFNAYGQAQQQAHQQLPTEEVGLMGEFKALEQKNNQQQEIAKQFDNASAGDITNFIMQNFQANGGKVNDQTYKLAYGVADTLFKTKNEAKKTAQEEQLFTAKMAEYERKRNEPMSAEGKLAQDFGMELTPDVIAKNPKLFGKADTATSNMKDFALFKNDPEFGKFLQSQKTSATSNLEKEFMFAKQNGYEGSPLEFVEAKKKATTTVAPTKVAKLMEEQKQFDPSSPEYQVYGKAIKLSSEGKENEAMTAIAGLLGDKVPISQKSSTPEKKGASPYAEGTILKGKDGKQYKVINGQPTAL